jgi:hypothetical protein
MKYDLAAAFCCSFGLQMIWIKSVWEEKCLADFFYIRACCQLLLYYGSVMESCDEFSTEYPIAFMYSWVYASKWATPDGRSIWCNTGEYFRTNISLNPPPYGDPNPFNHLFAVGMGNNMNVKSFVYNARNPTSIAKVLCEEH